MSEQTPPPEGQIHTPNPIEIFWEKNRLQIIAALVVLTLFIVGRWGLEEMARIKRNATWGEFAQKTGLREVYASKDAKLASMNLQPEQRRQFMRFLIQGVHTRHWSQVKGQLNSNLEDLSTAEIESIMKTYEGTPAGWWAEWVLACKYRSMGDVEKVESTLASLKLKAPDLEVFHKTSHPPVFVPDPEEDKKEKGKKKRDDSVVLKAEDDSLASVLVRSAKVESAFRKEHPELYEPTEPEGKTVVFETSEGKIQVRLYEKASPKTCAQFLKNVEEGLYKGLYFHEVWKKSVGAFESTKSEIAFFGNPNAKDKDHSKWTEFKSEKTIPFETNQISHFPYMLCAVRQDDRRDSDTQQVYFTGNDCAESRDGDYVVFGRIVNEEGKSLLNKIISGPLQSTQEEEQGKGKPSEAIQVQSVFVKK